MKKLLLQIFSTCLFFAMGCTDKSVNTPYKHDSNEVYLFYIHGGIVQQQGINAVSFHFGKYEYTAIIDTLERKGFQVLSEVRPKETIEKEYAVKVKTKVDSLITLGISPNNIVVAGASQGAYIAMETALLLKNPEVRFVLIGLCSDYAVKYYSDSKNELTGHFFSIYEGSDSKGSCSSIFSSTNETIHFEEVELAMGNGHAFLFKPYPEWIKPLEEWAKRK